MEVLRFEVSRRRLSNAERTWSAAVQRVRCIIRESLSRWKKHVLLGSSVIFTQHVSELEGRKVFNKVGRHFLGAEIEREAEMSRGLLMVEW